MAAIGALGQDRALDQNLPKLEGLPKETFFEIFKELSPSDLSSLFLTSKMLNKILWEFKAKSIGLVEISSRFSLGSPSLESLYKSSFRLMKNEIKEAKKFISCLCPWGRKEAEQELAKATSTTYDKMSILTDPTDDYLKAKAAIEYAKKHPMECNIEEAKILIYNIGITYEKVLAQIDLISIFLKKSQ